VISDRTVRYVATLTRTQDVDPKLGHDIRVAAHGGKMSTDDATRVIAALKQLPAR
jgi:hypothetical protein